MTRNWLIENLTGISLALLGAMIANALHIPLPWLLGSLFAVTLWKITNHRCQCDVRFRQAGQWVIGTSLGLHFTSQMVGIIGGLYDSILLGVIFAIMIGIGGALVLFFYQKVDFATAWFSSMVGGASEMATMAETYDAKVDFVASAHTLRIMLVVITIPFTFYYFDIHGNVLDHQAQAGAFSILGFVGLLLTTALLATVLQKVRFPVAWILAPLSVTAILTLCDIQLTGLPSEIKHFGQLCIGWSLGNKFSKGFFAKSPRFLLTVAVYNLIGLLLTVGIAFLLHHYSGIALPTLILSLSSGGIAEMTITAETLHLGVAVVTVFHVIRMTTVVLLTQPLFLFARRFFTKTGECD